MKKYETKFLTIRIIICYIIWVLGELAQLARASALHAEGQGFESPILHQVGKRVAIILVVIATFLFKERI